MSREPLIPAVATVIVVGLVVAVIIAFGGTDRIADRATDRIAELITSWQARRAVIVAGCPIPVDSTERTVIVVEHLGNRLVAECRYVGSTGTYYRGRR